MATLDLGLGLEGTHVLITGGAGFIGSATVEAFLAAGCYVTSLDLHPEKLLTTHKNLLSLKADISSEADIAASFKRADDAFGVVHCCVALAGKDLSVLPHHDSLIDMPLNQWQETIRVNVNGTFLTCREWLMGIRAVESKDFKELRNVSLIIVGSESGHFGERGNADYATGKAAVQVGLLQSLKGDVVRIYPGARVNAIAPGPVDTPQFRKECQENPEQLWMDAQATTAQRKPVAMNVVAKSILYLASDAWSGHVHGQILNVDSGKQGKVMWTKEECS